MLRGATEGRRQGLGTPTVSEPALRTPNNTRNNTFVSIHRDRLARYFLWIKDGPQSSHRRV
jgi:hypothetical protein